MIEEIDVLLSDYQNLGIGKGDSSETKIQLKIAKIAVDDTIEISKAPWSSHQSEKYTQCASTLTKCGRVYMYYLE